MAMLDAMRTQHLNAAVRVIQRYTRCWLQRRRFLALRKAAVKAQALWRGKAARKEYERRRREAAAVRIQKHYRAHLALCQYARVQRAVLTLQAGARGMFARSEARSRRRNLAATRIQTRYRGHRERRAYKKLRAAAVVMQCTWRGRAARLHLKRLKHEAKQTGALQAAKTRLEKQCEELTWRLQLEKRMRSDLEESKSAEIARLQQEMEQLKTDLQTATTQVDQLQAQLRAGGGGSGGGGGGGGGGATAGGVAGGEAARIGRSASGTHTAPSSAAASPVLMASRSGRDMVSPPQPGKHGAGARAVDLLLPPAAAAGAAGGAAAGGAAGGAAAGGAAGGAAAGGAAGGAAAGGAAGGGGGGASAGPSSPAARPAFSHPLSRISSARLSGSSPSGRMDHGATMGNAGSVVDGAASPWENEGAAAGEGGMNGVMVDAGVVAAAAQASAAMLENEKLKEALEASDSRAAAMEEVIARREERIRELEDDVVTLKGECGRLQEHLQGMEREFQVLRRQSLSMATATANGAAPGGLHAPQRAPSGRLSSALFGMAAHGGAAVAPSPPPVGLPAAREAANKVAASQEAEMKRHHVLAERQQADQDAVLQFVVSDLGFDNNRPVAACVLYRALLHWRSFDAEQTNVFDRIIQTMSVAVDTHDSAGATSNSADRLAFWLSNASALLHLLHRSFRPGGASQSQMQAQRRRQQQAATSLFGRMTQSFRGPVAAAQDEASAVQADGLQAVDPKFPALLFKQQLTAFVEKVYSTIRDNLKKDISQMLVACIQASRSFRPGVMTRQQQRGQPADARTAAQNQAAAPGVAQWSGIIARLTELVNTLKANHVPAFLVSKLFSQIFAYINVQLFNSLLLRRECCSFSNGEYVKAGLAELERWIYEATDEYAGSAWEELRFIRQAVGFLVIHQKPKKSLEDISSDLCPALSMQQLYRISTMYRDDKYGTHSVAPAVINAMRVKSTEESALNGTNSFLLDDDSSVPFAVDDICKELPNLSLNGLHMPPHLRDSGPFHFLFS
ncbi:unnamed protein product [Closterium sp. NIES-53]